MKNYKEIADSVLSRRDEQLQKINIRNKKIRRISAVCGAVVVMSALSIVMIHRDDVNDFTETLPVVNGDALPGVGEPCTEEVAGDNEAIGENFPTEDRVDIGDAPTKNEPEFDGNEGDDVEVNPIIPGGIGFGNWPVKYVPEIRQPDGVVTIPWENMTFWQQYPEFEFEGNKYNTYMATGELYIDETMLEDKLGLTTLGGYDFINNESHTCGATVYKINGIKTECAVAVDYHESGGGKFAVYTNSYYRPDTLGQFIEDIDLKSHISFGDIWYYYTDDEGFHTVRLTPTDSDMIWGMLLCDGELKNEYDYDSKYETTMSITVDVPVLGFYGVSLSLNDVGFMHTNIMDTAKAFFIGEDTAQKFMDYVLSTSEGVEIRYVLDAIIDRPEDDLINDIDTDCVMTDGAVKIDPILPTTTREVYYTDPITGLPVDETVVAVTSNGHGIDKEPPVDYPTTTAWDTCDIWDKPQIEMTTPAEPYEVTCDVETSPSDTEIAWETEVIWE